MFCNALVSLLTQPQPVSLTTRSRLSDWYNVLVIATQVHRCTHLTGDRLLQLWLLLDDLTRTWSVRPFYMEEGEEALPYPSSCLNRLRFACLWCLSDGVSVATQHLFTWMLWRWSQMFALRQVCHCIRLSNISDSCSQRATHCCFPVIPRVVHWYQCISC